MQKTIRTKKRSWTLPVTWFLGIGIGVTVFYGVAAILELNFAPSTPEPLPPEPPPVVEEVPEALALSTDLDGLWPAKHVFITLPGTALTDDTRAMLAAYKPGGVVLQAENLESVDQAARLIAEIKNAVGLGARAADWPLIALDPLGNGAMASLDVPFTKTPAELGREADTALTRSVALSYALTARDLGISIIFAPDCSLYTHGLSRAEIASRCFGQDVNAVNAHAQAYFGGLQEGNTLAVAMSYPGIGSALYEDGLLPIVQERSVERLARSMLPFSELVKGDVPGMLLAQVAVPGLDENAPHRPVAFSPILVDSVIRKEWEYDGVLIAEDISAPWLAAEGYGPGGATVAALTAGCDAVLLKHTSPETLEEVCGAILYATKISILRPTRLSASKLRLENWQQMIRATEPAPPEPVVPDVPEPPSEPEESLPPGITAPALEPVVKPPLPLEGDTAVTPEETPQETTPEEEPGEAEEPEAEEPAVTEEPKTEDAASPADDAAPDTGEEAPENDSADEVEEVPEEEVLPEAEDSPGEETEQAEQDEPVESDAPAEDSGAVAEADAGVEKDAAAPEEAPADAVPEEAPAEADNADPATEEAPPVAPEEEAATEEAAADAIPEAAPESAATEEAATAPIEEDTAAESVETPAETETLADAPEEADSEAEEAEGPAAEPEATEEAAAAPAPDETPVEAEASTEATADAFDTYTIQQGDTLSKIARKFNTTRADIIELNNLKNPDLLKFGAEIKVPKPEG